MSVYEDVLTFMLPESVAPKPVQAQPVYWIVSSSTVPSWTVTISNEVYPYQHTINYQTIGW